MFNRNAPLNLLKDFVLERGGPVKRKPPCKSHNQYDIGVYEECGLDICIIPSQRRPEGEALWRSGAEIERDSKDV